MQTSPAKPRNRVALLRGINVSGKNKIAMADLRGWAEAMGLEQVGTYIQSGNLVFSSNRASKMLQAELEAAILEKSGLGIPVLVRSAEQWRGYLSANPLPSESEQAPNRLMLCLSKDPPAAEAESELQARAASGEQVRRVGDALWIYFPQGVGSSKLTPAVLDRLAGSSLTARNWRSVQALATMLD